MASPFQSRVAREAIVFVRDVAGSAVCIGAGGALRGGVYYDNNISVSKSSWRSRFISACRRAEDCSK